MRRIEDQDKEEVKVKEEKNDAPDARYHAASADDVDMCNNKKNSEIFMENEEVAWLGCALL